MSQKKLVLITGASRGIGLGLVEKYLAKGYEVIAAARNPDGSRELWEAERDYGKRCRIVELDVTRDADLARLATELDGQAIDVLINNAGVMPDGGSFAAVSADAMLKGFTVNVLGPLRVLQHLEKNLRRGAVVATISSKMGSIGDNTSGGSYAYRVSKSAVNMLNRSFAADHPELIAVVLHPGWVKTDMGGSSAPTTVDESTNGIVAVLDGLTTEHSGRFFDFKGKELAW